MNRRPQLVLLSTWLLCAPVAAMESPSPSFVVILTDDQGWTGMSASMLPDSDVSSDYYLTPNMKRLAMSGIRFSQGYSSAALGCPSRRSLQFAQTPLRMGDDELFAKRYPVDNQRPTIPRLLKSANPKYAAAHFGKWDMRTEMSPQHLGYDEGDGVTGNGEGSLGDDGAPDPISKEGKWTEHAELHDPKRIFSLTNRASSFIERMTKASRPFYVQISHYAVHADIQLRSQTLATTKKRDKGRIHENPFYAAMTEDLDTGVGQLLDKLEQLGISDQTYVFFMADNGGVPWIPPDKAKHLNNPTLFADKGANHPLRAGKWTLFEGGLRVPFMVSGPGIKPGSFSKVPVVGWDILPTVADLAGYTNTLPADIDGQSFKPCLFDPEALAAERAQRPLFFHRYAGEYAHSAVTLGDYKLIQFHNFNDGGDYAITKLFDLRKDLGETHNIAAENPKITAQMLALLQQYGQAVANPAAGTSDLQRP